MILDSETHKKILLLMLTQVEFPITLSTGRKVLDDLESLVAAVESAEIEEVEVPELAPLPERLRGGVQAVGNSQ